MAATDHLGGQWGAYRDYHQAQVEGAHAVGAEHGTEEYDRHFGKGEFEGGGSAHMLSSREFMRQSARESDAAQEAHYAGEAEADDWVRRNS